MRALAIITYAVAGLLGLTAFVFGYGGIAMMAVYILLFGIAFHRIAGLQRQFSTSRVPSSGSGGVLSVALFSFALIAVVATFITRRPQLLVIAIYLSLFGCLFRGLASLRALVSAPGDATPHIPTKT
jgi:hypothetical protein